MSIGSLFSGYGGLDMGVQAALGGDVAWHCENDPAASRVLARRFPGVPNLGDITAVDWSAVEPVEVLTGGFPCQDVSTAGKRAGLRPDTRSGLWTHMAYAIDQLRPRLVVAENVRGLLSAPAHSDVEPCTWCVGDEPGVCLRALGAVLGDLAELGYDAQWVGVRASDVGAPHGRFRVFVVAHPNGARLEGRGIGRPRPQRPEPVGAPHAPTYAQGIGLEWSGDTRERRSGSPDGSVAAAHASSDGRHEGRPEPTRLVGRPDAAERGAVATDADRDGLEGIRRQHAERRDADGRRGADGHGGAGEHATSADAGSERRIGRTGLGADGRQAELRGETSRDTGDRPIAWGVYEPAVRRWERLTRPAPAPTETGPKGSPRLSPRFVEWLMGLPAGWVTDVPGISRNDQLKVLGNGVVPQQAAHALRLLLNAKERAA